MYLVTIYIATSGAYILCNKTMIYYHASKHQNIEKAEKYLGYQPNFN